MTAHETEGPLLASVVATRTRGLMAEQRMRQRDLAQALGIKLSGVNTRLTGAKDFDLNELPGLAAALNTSVEYLLGLSDLRACRDSNPKPSDP